MSDRHTKSLAKNWMLLAGLVVGLTFPLYAQQQRQMQIQLEPKNIEDVKDKPISANSGEVGEQLIQWYEQGTAAGNIGDIYDNRDDGHSPLRMHMFPQLQRVVYTDAQKQAKQNWGLSRNVMPRIVVGNSSTAAPARRGGSNTRMAYQHPQMAAILWLQYIHGNLYVYPEHHDYDAGRHGIEGHGDMFTLNTPYVIISRGSSYTDRPFYEAVLWTLAAFHPDVKRKLHQSRLLMPTVQMIMRRTLRHVDSEEDYLSGIAHPTAFDGASLNPMKMIQMAHDMKMEQLPPISVLQVESVTQSQLGVDYFIPQMPELLVQTPAATGVVMRGPHPRYEMVLNAGNSGDVNGRDLTYHWRVLRGPDDDDDAVRIESLTDDQSRVRISVRYVNESMKAPDDPKLEHRRIDVACFVNNGVYYSPPAMVSFYMPHNQRRAFDADGRVIEIGYGAYSSPYFQPVNKKNIASGRGAIRDYPKLMTAFLSDTPRGRFLRSMIDDARKMQMLKRMQPELEKKLEQHKRAVQVYNASHKAWNQARRASGEKRDPQLINQLEQERKQAIQARDAAAAELADLLISDDNPMNTSVRKVFHTILDDFRSNPSSYIAHQQALAPLVMPAASNDRERLVQLRILKKNDDGSYAITPLREGAAPIEKRLTTYEQHQLANFHDEVLYHLTDGATRRSNEDYVDPRIVIPRHWRDLYHYDDQGNMTGWTRYGDGEPKKFNAEGQLILETDEQGDPVETVKVQYEPDSNNPLEWKLQMKRQP